MSKIKLSEYIKTLNMATLLENFILFFGVFIVMVGQSIMTPYKNLHILVEKIESTINNDEI